MNHPGETGYLAGIAGPTIALVNNAQREHQEFMKSVEEVAAEHGGGAAGAAGDGVAVLNRDDAYLRVLGAASRARAGARLRHRRGRRRPRPYAAADAATS